MKQRLRGSRDVVTAAVELLLERITALRQRVMEGNVEIQVRVLTERSYAKRSCVEISVGELLV
jgi:hypothetical protein